jgi:hypothetical protein
LAGAQQEGTGRKPHWVAPVRSSCFCSLVSSGL